MSSSGPLWRGPRRADFPVGHGPGDTGEATSCRHALVDIDGDGAFEIASAGYGDGVRVIDPRTGRRLWSLPAPAPTRAKVAAANIDGPGKDRGRATTFAEPDHSYRRAGRDRRLNLAASPLPPAAMSPFPPAPVPSRLSTQPELPPQTSRSASLHQADDIP
jgi:hypothetical protein